MSRLDETKAATGEPCGRARWLRRAITVLKRNGPQISRYLLTSAVVYIFVFLALYLLVDLFRVGAVPAYVVVFFCAYVVEYTATLLLVFHGKHTWSILARFAIYVAVFLGISTLFYSSLQMFGVHYLVAAIVTSAVLMPLRYIANKRWVYR